MCTPRHAQIIDHVGQAAYDRAEAFSFCYGRGWKAHRSFEIAQRAARRDARACVRHNGGGEPQHMAVDK